MGATQINNLLLDMKLEGMLASLQKTVQEATQSSWTYTEFLDVLVQAESDHRKLKKAESRIRASKLPKRASFEDFDYSAKRGITKMQIREIQSLKWFEQGRPLILIGQAGVGKSFIAQAVGLQVCSLGKTVIFQRRQKENHRNDKPCLTAYVLVLLCPKNGGG